MNTFESGSPFAAVLVKSKAGVACNGVKKCREALTRRETNLLDESSCNHEGTTLPAALNSFPSATHGATNHRRAAASRTTTGARGTFPAMIQGAAGFLKVFRLNNLGRWQGFTLTATTRSARFHCRSVNNFGRQAVTIYRANDRTECALGSHRSSSG